MKHRIFGHTTDYAKACHYKAAWTRRYLWAATLDDGTEAEIKAETREEAEQRLRALGLHPTTITPLRQVNTV